MPPSPSRRSRRTPLSRRAAIWRPAKFAGVAAACSHYTTRKQVGLFGVEIKGLRITAPLGDLSYDIRMESPAKAWDKFEPTGNKIVESVTRGTG